MLKIILSVFIMMGFVACSEQAEEQAMPKMEGQKQVKNVAKLPVGAGAPNAVNTQDVKKDDAQPVAIQELTNKKSQSLAASLASNEEVPLTKPTHIAVEKPQQPMLMKETEVKKVVSKPMVREASPTAENKQAVVTKDAPQEVAALGDAIKGKLLSKRCLSCHSFEMKDKVGPHLQGVFNRAAGQSSFRKYGASLKAANWTWDEAHLLKWVCDSKAAIKEFTGDTSAKTKMPNQRMCGVKGNDIVAYLQTI